MILTLERITDATPVTEPVSLEQMKKHLRVDADNPADDEIIAALTTAAREWVEQYTSRQMTDRTWLLTASGYVSGELLLSVAVAGIASMTSVDAAGVPTVIDVADYETLDGDSTLARLSPVAPWPAGIIRVEYTTAADDVAMTRLKQAMKLWAEAMYDRDQYLMEKLLAVAHQIARPLRIDLSMA